MGKIDNYEAVSSFTGNERFVIETNEGTKKASFSLIQDKIADCVEDKAEMLSFSNVFVTKDTESEYILDITIGTTHITTPNLKGKSIKAIGVETGHLLIHFSDDTSIDAGIVDGSVPAYGVCRDINSHSPELKRVGDAVGLVAEVGVGSEIVRNDFDKIYPWCAMRKCTLADDGTVTSYFGDANYTEDGSIGQVMVEIPKYYYAHYFDEPEAYEYWYISKDKITSRYRLPQPFIAKDGTELDKIYIAAYPFSNKAIDTEKADSISGDAYNDGGTLTYQESIQFAASRGLNWHCMDIADWCDVIQPLFIVEFATLNSQSVMLGCAESGDNIDVFVSENQCIGDKSDGLTEIVGNSFYTPPTDILFIGTEIFITTDAENFTEPLDSEYMAGAIRNITQIEEIKDESNAVLCLKVTFSGAPIKITQSGNMAWLNFGRNGITNGIKASSGSISGAEGKCDMLYRGLENIYGAFTTYIGGVTFSNGKYYITLNINAHIDTISDEYTAYGENIDFSGYVNEMSSFGAPWIYLPISAEGTSDTDFCDRCNLVKISSIKHLTAGHSNKYNNMYEHGIFSYYGATSKQSVSAARLAYRAYE